LSYLAPVVIKICPRCRSTWAGGFVCEDCRTALIDPFADDAKEFPEEVWKYIRLQYGARRGMIVRVLAILLGPVVFVLLARRALVEGGAVAVLGVFGAAVAGALTWFAIHQLAGRAVRIWVLRRGRVRKARLARALLRRALR
jgi:hypothetical protein